MTKTHDEALEAAVDVFDDAYKAPYMKAAMEAAINAYLSKAGVKAWGVFDRDGALADVELHHVKLLGQRWGSLSGAPVPICAVLIVPQPETVVFEKPDLGSFGTPGGLAKEITREDAGEMYPQEEAGEATAGAMESVREVVRAAWQLLDGTMFCESMSDPRVADKDWKRLLKAYEALNDLVPDSERPFDGGHAVTYLWPKPTPSAGEDNAKIGQQAFNDYMNGVLTPEPSAGEDVVERLRYRSMPDQNGQYADRLCGEAADEIEHLRAEVETAKRNAISLAEMLEPTDARIKELEGVLMRYADEDIYSDFNNQGRLEKPLILRDRGESARSALSKTQG